MGVAGLGVRFEDLKPPTLAESIRRAPSEAWRRLRIDTLWWLSKKIVEYCNDEFGIRPDDETRSQGVAEGIGLCAAEAMSQARAMDRAGLRAEAIGARHVAEVLTEQHRIWNHVADEKENHVEA